MDLQTDAVSATMTDWLRESNAEIAGQLWPHSLPPILETVPMSAGKLVDQWAEDPVCLQNLLQALVSGADADADRCLRASDAHHMLCCAGERGL